MNIITPITITDAMVGAGTTVAEPNTGETAWSGSSVAYVVGDVRIRATTHRKYRCAAAHTSAASPTPENDSTRWVDIGPTDRWAPFDIYTSTTVQGTTSITYVLQPGYFNSLALYGLTGTQYSVTVKDAPGGATIYTAAGYLAEDPLGWYEYLFSAPRTINKLILRNIPIRPTAELTLTITAGSGQPVGIGMLVVGDYTPLVGDGAQWGGTLAGAQAEPVTYSYIKTNDDGTTTIVRRHAATNLRVQVALPREYADQALAVLQRVLDTPVAWVATTVQGYTGLTTFGLGQSSPVRYDSANTASIDINVKGLI
jgi:hypothetical protein